MNEQNYIAVTTELQQVVTTDQAWHYHIVPKSSQNGNITLYIDEAKYTDSTRDELEMLMGKQVTLEKCGSEIILQTLSRYYRKSRREKKVANISLGANKTEDFLFDLISEAHSLDCSDIHIEAYEEQCRLRMRIDGKLVERYLLNKADYPSLVNKVKIKANLDIAEKRLPQDGRIFFESGTDKFDIRVSILPTLHGEKIVLRLLSKDATAIDLTQLGFGEKQLEDYLEAAKKPHGIILISGPTGSGKTTSLYATLKILNKENTNILTIEDPIEYTLDGINQVQLKESIGLTFASALRTFLRQDPDIIMLGEIRDGETAQMAIRAALTGHLVLSTIHTNSAWGTISRLIDMGVPPFLLANTLIASLAQRLVRLLCPHCKEEQVFDNRLFPRNYKAPETIKTHFIAKGCEECFYTGYRGRKAAYEIIPIDYEFSEHIKNVEFEVSSTFKEKGITSLSDSAFSMFSRGITTIDEIYPILINA